MRHFKILAVLIGILIAAGCKQQQKTAMLSDADVLHNNEDQLTQVIIYWSFVIVTINHYKIQFITFNLSFSITTITEYWKSLSVVNPLHDVDRIFPGRWIGDCF